MGDGFYFPNTHLPRLRIFDTLKNNGVFGDFKLGNGNKMDVEGARLLMPTPSLWRDEITRVLV